MAITTPLSDEILFGEWMPDQPAYKNAGCLTALNVITNGNSYTPFKDLGEVSDALPARCYGGISYVTEDGSVFTFAATRTKIYQLVSGSWVDVTRLASPGPGTEDYDTAEDGTWRFVAFGNRIVATNYDDYMQTFVIGQDSEFSDLTTDLRCRDFAIIGEFLVAIDTFDAVDDAQGARVRWCAIGNPTSWTISPATQADLQDIKSGGGANKRILPLRNFGIIVQDSQLHRIEYVGPPLVFHIERIEEARGTKHPSAAVSDGTFIYYIDESGFQQCDGAASRPLGHRKIDRYFFNRLDLDNSPRIGAVADRLNKLILWSYPSTDSNGTPDRMLVYNRADDRFTEIEVAVDFIFNALGESLTLEDLDSLFATLDDIPISLDSRLFAGGFTNLAAFDPATGKIGYFDGDTLPATLISSESRINPHGRAIVQSIFPVTDCAAATGQVGYRNLLSESPVFMEEVPIVAETAEMPFNVNARFHRFQLNFTGDWTFCLGFQHRSEEAGNV